MNGLNCERADNRCDLMLWWGHDWHRNESTSGVLRSEVFVGLKICSLEIWSLEV
jgi:hypothetical protein